MFKHRILKRIRTIDFKHRVGFFLRELEI